MVYYYSILLRDNFIMKFLYPILFCTIVFGITIYATKSEAIEGSTYQCFHRVDYVKDSVPYAFVNSTSECPTPPETSKGHKHSVFVPKNTPLDHHCDTVKLPSWI